MLTTIFALSLAGLTPASQAALSPSVDLVTEFRTVCLDWDGDHNIVEEIALERGYQPSETSLPDPFRRFRYYATMNVWSKVEDGTRAQVLTNSSWIGSQGGEAHFEQCSALTDQSDFRATRTAIRDLTGVGWFQQKDASVFAWIDTPEGRRPVRRNRFDFFVLLRREPGLRVIMAARNDDGVVLTYMKPRGSTERFSSFGTPNP